MNDVRKKFDWAGLFWLFLFFWYFSAVTQILLKTTGVTGFSGVRESFYLSTIWLAPVLIFPRHTRLIAAIIGLILWGTAIVGLNYFLIYGQEFSQSAIFVMFESNTAEASEYLSQYFTLKNLFGILLYSLVGFLLWFKVRPVYLPRRQALIISTLLIICVVFYPMYRVVTRGETLAFSMSRVATRMEPAAPWQLAVSYMRYLQVLDDMQKLLEANAALPPLANLQDTNGTTPRTLVLVIGESTSRYHMSLYGYPRPTSPNLETLRREDPNLEIFTDVVASRPYTIEMLQQALTFTDQDHPDRFLTEPSMMNLMKQAGYKTFWITNQQTMTERNTMLTTFSKQMDVQHYLNNQRNQDASQFDEVVFAPFEEALKDPAPLKFIVVHLLGTHMNYKYRYPEKFARFHGSEGLPKWLTERQVSLINHYDNAVLYNDHIVSTLIRDYAKSQANGFLLYLSDHGEEVFDLPPHDILGRNEYAPTRGMYAVPFMLWESPAWRQSHPRDLGQYLTRPYSSAHLIHTWSDLAGLSYDGFLPQYSLVSDQYQNVPRWVGDPKGEKDLVRFDDLPPEQGLLANPDAQRDLTAPAPSGQTATAQ